ncbi:MAG: exodeoxyribonuclease VII small subunit [Actinomycetes bacterium]
MSATRNAQATTGEIGYAGAMVELEEILGELEGDDLDVDVLAERVRRAGELIALCRSRIVRAEADVAAIVTELEAYDGENPDDPSDED